MNEWISVKDRLPVEGTWFVAITTRRDFDNRAVTCTYASARYVNSRDRMPHEATHWMPLPSPPVVVNEESK